MSTSTHQTVYVRITSSIIAALEQGVAPWVRPWAIYLPYNAVSRRHYRGVDVLSCLAHQLDHGHACSAYFDFPAGLIVMELRGIEPLTTAVRLQRSPS